MRWTIYPKPDPQKIVDLAQVLGVDTNIASLLVQRGIESYDEAKKYFRPSLEDLHNPFLMKDMDLAVDRIEAAIASEENILVLAIMTWMARRALPWFLLI